MSSPLSSVLDIIKALLGMKGPPAKAKQVHVKPLPPVKCEYLDAGIQCDQHNPPKGKP